VTESSDIEELLGGSMGSIVHDRAKLGPITNVIKPTRRNVLGLAAFVLGANAGSPAIAASADGQLTWGVHVSLAPTWFDPAETAAGLITPFMLLYALHDAMVKAMPGQLLAPSLADSWSVAEGGLSHDFVIRKEARFHNGDPVTAEDVKFSFERYRGTLQSEMKTRIATIEISDPWHIRFSLREPWPDFPTLYTMVTGAGWIVPKSTCWR
jgi:peptide/nickel transport system substrate-binding protein